MRRANLSDAEWYDLAFRLGDLKSKLWTTYYMISRRFGKSQTISQRFFRILTHFRDDVAGDLDSAICASYPLNINTLPPDNNLPLIDVFYTVNYDFTPPTVDVGPFKKYPKTITEEQRQFIQKALNQASQFISETERLLDATTPKKVLKCLRAVNLDFVKKN